MAESSARELTPDEPASSAAAREAAFVLCEGARTSRRSRAAAEE